MNYKFSFFSFLLILTFFGCKETQVDTNLDLSSDIIVDCNSNLTDALVERHFTPPVAAKNYAYSNIALYSATSPFFTELNTLNGQIKDFNCEVYPDTAETYNLEVVALNSFSSVALKMVYSDTVISNFLEARLAGYKATLDPSIYDRSIEYSDDVAKYVLSWADGDNYKETRNFEEFSPGEAYEEWKPTSPDYMPAIEPFWGTIRTLVLDSSNQYMPIRPTTVDMTEGATFYNETMEVLYAVDTIDEERKEIALFWDCNPNISHHHGHVMYFLQKISPGGHWIHIATQALDNKQMNFSKGAAVMTTLGIGLHDAFVACWEEKYYSNYVRPETVIRANINEDWKPILQTPAFPEYPSGHSVASASAATILTDLLGENFDFIDSTELKYGLPVREFSSFRDASDEAAISRLYGGIHYMPAITEGVKLGNNVGDLVNGKIKLLK